MGYYKRTHIGTKIIERKNWVHKAKLLAHQDLCWNGSSCLIIGGGPSIRGFTTVSVPLSYKIITINRSFQHYPESDLNYCMDNNFYQVLMHPVSSDDRILSEHWKKYTGIKVFARHNHKETYHDSVFVVDEVVGNVLSFDVSAGIGFGNNSGYGAISLAVALGVKRIVLIGFDFYIDGERSHGHEGYGKNMKEIETARAYCKTLMTFCDKIAGMASGLKACGIEVYNLNPRSNLRAFPFISLNDL